MKILSIILSLTFMIGCGMANFTSSEGDEEVPIWSKDLRSTVEQERVGKRQVAQQQEGDGTAVVQAPTPQPPVGADTPEWATQLQQATDVTRVGKKAFSQNQQSEATDLVEVVVVEEEVIVDEVPVVDPSAFVDNNKLDIIFIVDTSHSMDSFLRKSREKFKGFLNALKPLDWRILFTNATDNKHRFFSYNLQGSVMPFEHRGVILKDTHYLTKDTPNHRSIFLDTLDVHTGIASISTMGRNEASLVPGKCQRPPFCGSYNEQPLKAMRSFLKKNVKYLRDDANVVTVIISDSDEGEHTDPAHRTTAEDVVHVFNDEFGGEYKKFIVYGILVKPGDEKCQKQQGGFLSNENLYAVRLSKIVELTKGTSASICDKNYTSLAEQITSDFFFEEVENK